MCIRRRRAASTAAVCSVAHTRRGATADTGRGGRARRAAIHPAARQRRVCIGRGRASADDDDRWLHDNIRGSSRGMSPGGKHPGRCKQSDTDRACAEYPQNPFHTVTSVVSRWPLERVTLTYSYQGKKRARDRSRQDHVEVSRGIGRKGSPPGLSTKYLRVLTLNAKIHVDRGRVLRDAALVER